MKGSRSSRSALSLAALSLAGCTNALDGSATNTVVQYAIDTSIQRPAEDDMLALSQKVEAFAGFYCSKGDLVVGIAPWASLEDREKIVSLVFELNISTSCYNREIGLRAPKIVLEEKKYNFLTLRTWRDSTVEGVFKDSGAQSIGIKL